MKSWNLLSKKLELFYRDIQQKREQIAENTTMRLQTDFKKSIKNIMLKCLVVVSEVVKLMLLSRKLENSKNVFLKVNVYIKKPGINVLIQEN